MLISTGQLKPCTNVQSKIHLFKVNNNNIFVMVSHLVRAQSADKDIRIRLFHHTHNSVYHSCAHTHMAHLIMHTYTNAHKQLILSHTQTAHFITHTHSSFYHTHSQLILSHTHTAHFITHTHTHIELILSHTHTHTHTHSSHFITHTHTHTHTHLKKSNTLTETKQRL